VIGDKRKYLSALIVPNFEELEAWARSEGITFADKMDLITNDRVDALYKMRIDGALKEYAKFEKIVQFTLLPEELSVETGLLTPTLKVRRRQVMEAFDGEISEMYKGD
jgi:long-chain acyl-CoA synthetase